MSIGDERNRPRVVDHVHNIHVHANHYRYSARYSIRWKSSVDSESSEVDDDQKFGPCIIKGTVKHDRFNVDIVHVFHSEVVVWKIGVSDKAEGVNGTYTNSDRISCSTGSQRHTVVTAPKSVDVYRILKFRRVAKRIISSKLPNGKLLLSLKNIFEKQKFYLQQRYSNSYHQYSYHKYLRGALVPYIVYEASQLSLEQVQELGW